MKCIACGHAELVPGREEYRYESAGIEGVTLAEVPVYRCPSCGEAEVSIPRLEALDRTIALALIEKPEPLTGSEVRFLRTHLDLTAAKLALVLGIDKATVSRWENDRVEKSPTAERVLRALVRELDPVPGWALATFPKLTGGKAKSAHLRLEYVGGSWRLAA